MKTNFFKGLILFTIVTALFSVLIQKFSMGLFYGWYPLVKYQSEVSKGLKKVETVKTLAVGNSQLLTGLNPTQIENLRSLAFPGASPIEYYYILEDYLENHNAPKEVFLVYFPYNFYVYKENFWMIHLRYGFHSLKNIFEILYSSLKTDDFYMLDSHYSRISSAAIYLFKSLSIKYNFFWFYLRSIHEGVKNFKRKQRRNISRYQGIERTKGHWLVRTPKHINHRAHLMLKAEHSKNKGRFYPRPLMDEYLKKTRNLLAKYKIRTKVTVMPNRSDIRRDIGEKGRTEYMAYLKSVFEENSLFKVIDTPSIDDKNFADRQHLSDSGAKIYTDYFKTLIDN